MLPKPIIIRSFLSFLTISASAVLPSSAKHLQSPYVVSDFTWKPLNMLPPSLLVPIHSLLLHFVDYAYMCCPHWGMGRKCLPAGLLGYVAAGNSPNLFPFLCLQALGVLSPGSVLSHWLCTWPCGTTASVTPVRDLKKKCLHFGVCPLLFRVPPCMITLTSFLYHEKDTAHSPLSPKLAAT